MVVAHGEVLVDHDVHAERVLEVEELLLLVPHDHRDVLDARLAQLADLPLDEALAPHAQQALGLLVGDGRAPRREPCGHDDRVSHPVRLERVEPGLREGAVAHEARVFDRLERPADRT